MSFRIYTAEKQSNGQYLFARKYPEKTRAIVGRTGALTNVALTRGLGEKGSKFRVTAAQMLGGDASSHRLISDVYPKSEDNSLYSLEYVSVYSHDDFAPIVMHLIKIPGKKESFVGKNYEKEYVRSFLYIRKNPNIWKWGNLGQTSGPLVWPPAMDFFIDEITEIGKKGKLGL